VKPLYHSSSRFTDTTQKLAGVTRHKIHDDSVLSMGRSYQEQSSIYYKITKLSSLRARRDSCRLDGSPTWLPPVKLKTKEYGAVSYADRTSHPYDCHTHFISLPVANTCTKFLCLRETKPIVRACGTRNQMHQSSNLKCF
jgi:hypothetical protein